MDMNKNITASYFILSENAYNEINRILEELALKTRADLIIFSDSNGYPITSQGNFPDLDTSVMASLAANNFSATAEMASLLGEAENFKYLFHEGEKFNIYISNVGYNYILSVIFKKEVAIGLIRIMANKAGEAIHELLNREQQEEQTSTELMDSEFSSLLDKELDKLLKI